MRKTVDLFKSQLVGLEDNVNDVLVAAVKVNYNHQLTPLQHLSLIDQRDRRISITPYDPTMVGAIEEELKRQGFNAYKFSKTTVVVNIPMASGEARQKVVSQMKKLGEEAKVAIRNIRKKFRKKNKDEDHDKRLQEATNAAIKEIDELCS
jgi:ribosome recycling factor